MNEQRYGFEHAWSIFPESCRMIDYLVANDDE